MNNKINKFYFSIFAGFVAFVTVLAPAARGATGLVRWTGAEDKNADFAHIVQVVNEKTGLALTPANYKLFEDRDLANNHFRMYVEQAGGVPMQGKSIRTWTSKTSGEVIQVEALVSELPTPLQQAAQLAARSFSSQQTMQIVQNAVAGSDDHEIRAVKWRDVWEHGRLNRRVTVKGKHGEHTLVIFLHEKRLSGQTYREFPQNDGEFSIPVKIFKTYEQVEDTKEILARSPSELKYLLAFTPRVTSDPYAGLRDRRYYDNKFDPLLGLTPEGQAQGYWAMSDIKQKAAKIFAGLPLVANSFANGGVILQGRYATVNFAPAAGKAYPGMNFTPGISPLFKPDFKPTPENPDRYEMIPQSTLLGQPILSEADALGRPAVKYADNNTVSLINDGFDEIQVYWAVNQMFESLHNMGFTDPELSTRRFNAFLYDPDIEYRDNAFYTDDTINFTTYSSTTPNMARDNSTIWHELGHGVMDRLMGDEIQLADTGGLSEGMADFVAQMVLNDVTDLQDYPGKTALRIFNQTGFNLTNEVHDDGEAYGGTMNDLLVSAIRQFGRPGLTKVVDLTLETMRLTRNHPGLTAADWFNHMIFADSLGNGALRGANELHDLIAQALAGRNFVFDGSTPASMTLKNDADEIVAGKPGSRNTPIRVTLAPTEKKTYHLSVNLKDSASYQFKYPVTVKVQLTGGPIQGAIRWDGEEASPKIYTLNAESDTLPIDLTVSGKCDEINRPDNTCVDYAYVQIWNKGETLKPQAKKRFYLRIGN